MNKEEIPSPSETATACERHSRSNDRILTTEIFFIVIVISVEIQGEVLLPSSESW